MYMIVLLFQPQNILFWSIFNTTKLGNLNNISDVLEMGQTTPHEVHYILMVELKLESNKNALQTGNDMLWSHVTEGCWFVY